MIERKTLELMAQSQLKQIAEQLNGRLITSFGKDSSGKCWRSVTIEYLDSGSNANGK